jgi:hypothetical protein
MRAKSLLDHVRDGTFRPRMHTAVLAREALPVKPPHANPTPAMNRLWSRLRDLQSEFRDVTTVDVRHDLARAFSRGVTDYLDAATRTRRDPLQELAGLREIITVNRYARRLHQAEQDEGRELADDERAAVMHEVRRELRPSRRAR